MIKVDLIKDKIDTIINTFEFQTRSKLYLQLATLQRKPNKIIKENYPDYPNTFGYLKKMWTKIIKKVKQQQQQRNNDNNNNDTDHSDYDDGIGKTNDEDDESSQSIFSTSNINNCF